MAWRGRALTRRSVLGGGLLALAGAAMPGGARAIGEATRVTIATAVLPGGEPFPRPDVPRTLLFEVARNTSTEVRLDTPALALTDPALFEHPLLFMAGLRGFPPLPDKEREALSLYLRSGGMVFADDCSGLPDGDFARSIVREMAAILPGQPMATLDRAHAIYRTFFLINRTAGRVVVRPWFEGIPAGEVTPIILSRNDLLGALAQDSTGSYLYETVPGGNEQRMLAYKSAINLVMYALTLNYKLDATHVRALLKKKRGVYDE